MQRVYVVGMQVIYIPLGIVIARLFHCSDAGMLNVDNSMQCWQVSIWVLYGIEYIQESSRIQEYVYVLCMV